jgi:hypothetical protein
MNYYLKYLKYKQKYLDLKNLDLIDGLSLSNNNYNNLDGGVHGIASDYEEHAHLLDDYANEEIADYWRTNINSTTFSANPRTGWIHQPGYYLMFYDSNGDYYDTTNDEKDHPRNPKFYDNHIHLLESKLENGRNVISFILKLKKNKIKIDPQCLSDAEHLNKYCKKKGIVGYDKLRMMIFLLKDFPNIYYTPTHQTDNQYDILLDINDPKLTYEINGVIRPILTRREITKCIETLEMFAIICTAISKIDEINTGGTGVINFYEAMNPTQFNQYLSEINVTELSSYKQKERYRVRKEQIQDKKEDFLEKTKELIVDSEESIILISQLIQQFKTDYKLDESVAISKQLIDATLIKMKRETRSNYSQSNDGTYEERRQQMDKEIETKTNLIEKVLKDYNSLKQSLEKNALKIREVNEDNSPHLLITLEDMDLDKNVILSLQRESFTWPNWYDWLVKRKDISKDNIEYRKRVEQRANKLEAIRPHLEYMEREEEENLERARQVKERAIARAKERGRERAIEMRARAKERAEAIARQGTSGGPMRNRASIIRHNPY